MNSRCFSTIAGEFTSLLRSLIPKTNRKPRVPPEAISHSCSAANRIIAKPQNSVGLIIFSGVSRSIQWNAGLNRRRFELIDGDIQGTLSPAEQIELASLTQLMRDEFTFRCVYCLKRETWGQFTGEFELDHFEPQSLAPDFALDEANLVNSCRRCNQVKLDQRVEDPLVMHLSESAAAYLAR